MKLNSDSATPLSQDEIEAVWDQAVAEVEAERIAAGSPATGDHLDDVQDHSIPKIHRT